MHTSLFKIIESSWGIIIEIKGKIELFSSKNISGIVKIDDFLFLDLSKYEYMSDENKNKIINGLVWVNNLIPKDKKIVLIVEEFSLNPANFQIEGLFFGMAQWISSYYNFPLPDFHYKYSKTTNKYIFWFDESDKRSSDLLYPNSDSQL